MRRTVLAILGMAVLVFTSAAGAQAPPTQVITNQPPATPAPANQPSAKPKTSSKQSKKKQAAPPAGDESAAPDKVLYDRAQADISKGRHEIGRLNLQTLINTYPDSEYLAKAKLAIADSYYKEGGPSNWTQAIAGYKDFIVFFPFLPEAPYAQMQVAMTHFREMEKPDRDHSEARSAEEEFQTFLAKYPNDPLAPKAMQQLRVVQEVLAEGDFRIGYYYYVKGDRRAAAGRLISVVKRYPLYSKSDQSLWMLGDIFEKSEKKEIASVYYARIVKDYPLSSLVGEAKKKLVAFGVPVPQPDPKALAWMQAEVAAPRPHPGIISRGPMSLVHSGPGQQRIVAAQTGQPNMEPESDTSAADVLTGGGKAQIGVGGGGGAPGNTAVVEVATPGTGASGGSTVEAGDTGTTTAPAPAAEPNSPSSDPATPPPTDGGSAASGTPGGGAAAGTTANPTPAAGSDTAAAPAAAASGTGTDSSAAGTSTDPNAKPADNSSSDSGKESTSKKKKGIHKIIPW